MCLNVEEYHCVYLARAFCVDMGTESSRHAGGQDSADRSEEDDTSVHPYLDMKWGSASSFSSSTTMPAPAGETLFACPLIILPGALFVICLVMRDVLFF